MLDEWQKEMIQNDPYFMYEYSRYEALKVAVDNTLGDNEIKINEEVKWRLDEYVMTEGIVDIEANPDYYIGYQLDMSSNAGYYTHEQEVTITGLMDNENTEYYGQLVTINQATLDTFFDADTIYQVVVLVNSPYEANKVIAEIEDLGFNAIYPASIADPFEQISSLLSGILFGFLLTIFTIIIWVVTYLVLRNVQKAKQKDYLIFRSIGASKSDLNKITNLELILSMTYSYVIILILLVINERLTTPIPHYLGYFNLFSYLLVYGIIVILALLLGASFNKRIFSKSVITSLKQE